MAVAAKPMETRKLLQGWEKAGDQADALLDLAKRCELDLGSDPASLNQPVTVGVGSTNAARLRIRSTA